MLNKRSISMAFVGVTLVIISLLSLGNPFPVKAQCAQPGDQPSSCITCHEAQFPISKEGEWHMIHADKDICTYCHGGNATSNDKEVAHESMTTNPLDDIYTDCHACHPDYDERAERFATALGITPGSCATPTPIAAGHDTNEPPSQEIVIPTNNAIASSTQLQVNLLLVSSGMLIVAVILFAISWQKSRSIRY